MDLAALDVLVAVVDRRVAEDVLVLDVGKPLGGELRVAAGRRGPLGPGRRRRRVVSLAGIE